VTFGIRCPTNSCLLGSVGMQRRVSAWVDCREMSLRQRQSNQLRDLCSAGSVVRAIDLAFEHFSHFGRDDEILEMLTHAMEDPDVAGCARRRFAELCASHDSLPSGIA
jgi:hypothetical protein